MLKTLQYNSELRWDSAPPNEHYIIISFLLFSRQSGQIESFALALWPTEAQPLL